MGRVARGWRGRQHERDDGSGFNLSSRFATLLEVCRMRHNDESQLLCKARSHLIKVAIDYDVRITLTEGANKGEWVAAAFHERGEHWTATASELLQAVLQLELLLMCSHRL